MRRVPRWSADQLIFPTGLIAIWLASFAIYTSAMINNDVAWYLTATDKWVSGARLYDEVFEVNPPLVFYLDLLPVTLARLTGIRASTIFVACVFVLIGLSTAVASRLITTPPDQKAAPWAMRLCILAAIVLFPAHDFGQREHLMLVFVLPYFFLVARRSWQGPTDWPTAVLVGMLAGIGFCLKPQFLLIPILLEIYLAFQIRGLWSARRPELLAIAIVGVVYAASIPLVASDYLSRIVPYALLVYQKGYGRSFEFVAMRWETFALAAVLFSHAASRRRQQLPCLGDVLLIGSVAIFFIYLQQMRGFSYQLLPVSVLMFLGIASAVASGGRPALGATMIVAMLFITAAKGTYSNRVAQALAPAVEERAKGRSFYAFSSYVWVGFPLVDMVGARWASRFPALWLLPGAKQGLRSENGKTDGDLANAYLEIERYTLDAVVEDLAADPPAVIVIDERADPRFQGTGFNYLSFFGQDQRFVRIWAQYVKLARVQEDGIGPFDVYVRREGLGDSQAGSPDPAPR